MHLSVSETQADPLAEASPLLTESATEEESDLEEMCLRQKCRKTIKSGKVITADSMVVIRITWPRELIYTTGEQPIMHEQLSMPLFMSGYLAVLDMVKVGL